MKIAVCDDEKNILEEVRDYITVLSQEMQLDTDIDLFQEARDLEKIDNTKYDITFLDIEMGDVNGIELAKKIKKRHPLRALT